MKILNSLKIQKETRERKEERKGYPLLLLLPLRIPFPPPRPLPLALALALPLGPAHHVDVGCRI